MLEIKITLASILVGVVAAYSSNEIAQVLISGGIGAALGGAMGASYFPGKSPGPMSIKRRWWTNFCTGFCLGPLLTWWLQPKYFAQAPLIFIALAASAAVGAIGVLLLTLTIPPFSKWLANRLFPKPNKDD